MILRAVVGLHAIFLGVCLLATSNGLDHVLLFLALLEISIGVGFLAGFLTPFLGVLAALGYLVFVVQMLLVPVHGPGSDIVTVISLAAISVALILLGPGAFSLDARFFGRREIIIPRDRHPPR